MASCRVVVLLSLVYCAVSGDESMYNELMHPPTTPVIPPPPYEPKPSPLVVMNDGLSMPMIAFGTGRGTAAQNDTLDLVKQSVRWAIEAGYRHIDTAAIYGDEEAVGEAIADAITDGIVRRDELFITTKLWNNRHEELQVVPALRESLKKLQLEYVDLYLIHFPVSLNDDGSIAQIHYLETWRGMEMTRMIGISKSIGVSNFNQTQLTDIFQHASIKPSVNQIEVNPTMTQELLVDFCQRLGITVMAYSPLGFLVSRRQGDTPPPRIDDPDLLKIARKYNKTTTQVVLRAAVDRGLVPVVKSTNLQRLRENLDIFDFELTETEVANVASFNRHMRIIYPVEWKESPFFPFELEFF